MRYLLLFVTILAVGVTTGCGDGKIATIKVTGTITFEGEPLADASVNFTPETEGAGHPAYGTTDASGHYVLQTLQGKVDAGTTPGSYLVTISKTEKRAIAAPTGEYDGNSPADDPNQPPPKSLIPERYARVTTSELTATVSKESTVFDFDLKK